MTNVDSVLKSRDTTLPTKVSICKAMVFPVVMCGCESWTIQKAEHWRTDASEPWCWRRLLRVPWTSRRSNQSILKEINPEYSLEEVMRKLKHQYFGHLMQSPLIGKDPEAGKDWGQKEQGATEDEMVGWHHGHSGQECEWTPGESEGQGASCSPWGRKVLDTPEWLKNHHRRHTAERLRGNPT